MLDGTPKKELLGSLFEWTLQARCLLCHSANIIELMTLNFEQVLWEVSRIITVIFS